jgi:hypothetical protein
MKKVELTDEEIAVLVKWHLRKGRYLASRAVANTNALRAHNLTQYLDGKENDDALRSR